MSHVEQPGSLDIAALRAAATVTMPSGRQVRPAGSAGRSVRWTATVLLPAVLLAGVGLGLWWARAGDRARPQVASGEMAWPGTLTELDARRSMAFAAGDAGLLAAVYAAGSAALAADTEQLRALQAAGVTARGLRITVIDAGVRQTGPGRVVLGVRDVIRPYQLLNAHGALVAQRAGRGERSWLITLVPATEPLGEWRIETVRPAAA
ncbi:MAG TPA: hypothetical protein VKG85_04160 [Actinomycetes bacterium]|nr:hypothetical protein [Actinomycetes bacterium]